MSIDACNGIYLHYEAGSPAHGIYLHYEAGSPAFRQEGHYPPTALGSPNCVGVRNPEGVVWLRLRRWKPSSWETKCPDSRALRQEGHVGGEADRYQTTGPS